MGDAFFSMWPAYGQRSAASLWRDGACSGGPHHRRRYTGTLIYFWRIYFGFSAIQRVSVLQRHQIHAHIIIIIMVVTPTKAVFATKGKDHSANVKESVGDDEKLKKRVGDSGFSPSSSDDEVRDFCQSSTKKNLLLPAQLLLLLLLGH